MTEACATPIQELLRTVPLEHRLELEINPTHHRMIPVGQHCAAAANYIDGLKEHNAALEVRAVNAEARCNSAVCAYCQTEIPRNADCILTHMRTCARHPMRDLVAKMEEYDEAARIAQSETCTADEQHCTCVPLLRVKIKELRTALESLVVRCDGEEGVRADGSNMDTSAAHAILARNENTELRHGNPLPPASGSPSWLKIP